MRTIAYFLGALLLASGPLLGSRDALAQGRSPASTIATRSADRSEGAISFYRDLAKRPGNIFASPYSLEMALAMAQAGARGRTAKEFDDVLGSNPASSLAAPAGNGLTFEVANALWVRRGLSLNSDYLAQIATRFDGSVRALDFSAPKSAADIINRWASDKTHGRIQSVVSPAAVSSDTGLIMTDAVYFKGVWGSPFRPDDTYKDSFHLASGRVVQTDTMHQTSYFELYIAKGFKLLVMYFKGGAEPVQMVVLLPDRADGLPALEAKLNATALDDWISNANERLVDVALPKFTHADTVQLRDVVRSMGLSAAFSSTQADFSGIAPLTHPRLHLSDVIQSVFIDLNESGAEAAAVTAVTMTMATAAPGEVSDPSVPFIADHPFLYLIRDEKTGDILFIGRMAAPS